MNDDILPKLDDIRASIVSQLDGLINSLQAMLGSDALQGNLADLKLILESCLFLKKETERLLDQKVLKNALGTELADYLTKTRHDLRNPINVMKGYAEMVLEDVPQNEALSKALTTIKEILNSINSIKVEAPVHKPKLALTITEDRIPPDEIEAFRSFKEKFSILIVDDVKENCGILDRQLRHLGFKNILSVNDGFQALEAVKRCDLMLLDIEMPKMSGIDVLMRVKNEILSQKLIVLMISAADTLENTIECIKLGAQDFLPKPFDSDLLSVRMSSCLEKAWFVHKENILRTQIEYEKKLYEGLLHSIFPPSVVKELAETGTVKTRIYPNVAVLFVDVVNFTPFCDTHGLDVIVKNLQEFANLCEVAAMNNNVQKIKTIGDCFLGESGMLVGSENPVLNLIKCAQEIIKQLAVLIPEWQVHVGIHFGEVIGGVVGKRQYLFDVWGDVVNTSARIQSISKPNTIYLSRNAWDQVSSICKGQSLGEMSMKGKRALEVFELT